jgi:molecular chaperone DnaK (HSP70)
MKEFESYMIRKLIISLSIALFALSGIITVKALRIPINNSYHQNKPKDMESNSLSPKSEDVLTQLYVESGESQKTTVSIKSQTKDTKELNQNNENLETAHTIDRIKKVSTLDKDNVPEESYQSISNASKAIAKTIADDQYISQIIYTIQTGSFLEFERAQKQFDSILQKLSQRELEYLRIEKVDKYYCVRLAKFEGYTNAKKLL